MKKFSEVKHASLLRQIVKYNARQVFIISGADQLDPAAPVVDVAGGRQRKRLVRKRRQKGDRIFHVCLNSIGPCCIFRVRSRSSRTSLKNNFLQTYLKKFEEWGAFPRE
jgi:hypothetical protein